uniref:Idi-3 n=1 Tax=Colletotrichum fructicola (strain Nara gc5) TaxID=1213859 RepID=L2FW71_COLFN
MAPITNSQALHPESSNLTSSKHTSQPPKTAHNVLQAPHHPPRRHLRPRGPPRGAPNRQPLLHPPPAVFQYNVRDGAIYPASWGYVSKYPQNAGNDFTTLLTFTYPAAAAGKKCQFAFFADANTYAGGRRPLDRNANIGRVSIVDGGYATWDATYGAYLSTPSDCKPAGTVEGLELVGVNDNDYVSFPPTAARILYN